VCDFNIGEVPRNWCKKPANARWPQPIMLLSVTTKGITDNHINTMAPTQRSYMFPDTGSGTVTGGTRGLPFLYCTAMHHPLTTELCQCSRRHNGGCFYFGMRHQVARILFWNAAPSCPCFPQLFCMSRLAVVPCRRLAAMHCSS
jgi:hypothetical protein